VIPGAKLYLVASTLANYNIRYVQPDTQPSIDQVRQKLGLGDEAIITALPPCAYPSTLAASFAKYVTIKSAPARRIDSSDSIIARSGSSHPR
jgi:hypothetical protein